MNTELINQEYIKQELESLERGYVETVINLIKGPIFIDNCERSIKEAEGERKDSMEKLLEQHKTNQSTNKEALETLEKVILEVKTLIK